MAAKWCPSLNSSYDKLTLICEGIARKLFPQELYSEYREIEESHYAFRVQRRSQKQVLFSLRKALGDPNRSTEKIQNSVLKKTDRKIISVYQSTYRRMFTKDDDERYRVYLEIADRCSKARIRCLPHQLVASLNGGLELEEAVELQWRKLVENLSKKGEWGNCVAICHVSEKMKGTTMEYFSIGMGLLLSELNREPWKGGVFTYGSDPKLCKIEGNSLKSKFDYMRQLQSGGNIKFSKVFDEILQVGVAEKLSQEGMVKKIFVFTDMTFEKAANNFWAKWACLARYESEGYGELPEIMYWNVGESLVREKTYDHKGLVMIRGFSTSFVAMLLEKGVVPTLEEVAKLVPKPEDVMKFAISGDEFQDLFVFD